MQLSASIDDTMPIDVAKFFQAAGWEVFSVDGHDFEKMWQVLQKVYEVKEKPIVIVGQTIMGKGVDFMEKDGVLKKATWHGSAPKKELVEEWMRNAPSFSARNEKLAPDIFFENSGVTLKGKPYFDRSEVDMGVGKVYGRDEGVDCRTAYGMALLDLVEKNKNIIALSADLKGSVMTKFVAEKFPGRHIECGISEQNMVSVAGALSLDGYIPFVSTFGAFMTSRAKDQVRVNDINETNVKMIATHCGLSVGEDGPTHQAIDDMGSMLGLFNTEVIEPADPNHTDRIIRFISKEWGNFYVRMGRHKFPVLLKENGEVFFDEKYEYYYGKSDVIRNGTDLTLVVSGAISHEGMIAYEKLKSEGTNIELVVVSSIKKFDETVFESVKKTGKVLTVEDHNIASGLGTTLGAEILKSGILVSKFVNLGVERYQLSGKVEELYEAAGVSGNMIYQKVKEML